MNVAYPFRSIAENKKKKWESTTRMDCFAFVLLKLRMLVVHHANRCEHTGKWNKNKNFNKCFMHWIHVLRYKFSATAFGHLVFAIFQWINCILYSKIASDMFDWVFHVFHFTSWWILRHRHTFDGNAKRLYCYFSQVFYDNE